MSPDSHQGQEDRLPGGQACVDGPSHSDRYGELGHLASLFDRSGKMLRVPSSSSVGFTEDWLVADAHPASLSLDL